jgi:hypothetical protein
MSIRKVVKDVMVNTFFEEENFRKFMEKSQAKELIKMIDIDAKVEQAMASEGATAAIDAKFAELSQGEMFLMYTMMSGIQPDDIKINLVKPFILDMGKALAPLVLEIFDPASILQPEYLRSEMDIMLEERLVTLDADTVTALMEDVMRAHLGWLIVYGNVFGARIGVVCALARWP